VFPFLIGTVRTMDDSTGIFILFGRFPFLIGTVRT